MTAINTAFDSMCELVKICVRPVFFHLLSMQGRKSDIRAWRTLSNGIGIGTTHGRQNIQVSWNANAVGRCSRNSRRAGARRAIKWPLLIEKSERQRVKRVQFLKQLSGDRPTTRANFRLRPRLGKFRLPNPVQSASLERNALVLSLEHDVERKYWHPDNGSACAQFVTAAVEDNTRASFLGRRPSLEISPAGIPASSYERLSCNIAIPNPAR